MHLQISTSNPRNTHSQINQSTKLIWKKLTTSTSCNSGRSARGRGRSSCRGGRSNDHNNNRHCAGGSTGAISTGSTSKEKAKFLAGNKGPESHRKFKEALLVEANIKFGADMAHVILKEEEPVDPVIKLAAPATAVAMMDATADEKLKEEGKPKGSWKL